VLAVLSAQLADLGADAAGAGVQVRAAQHEVGAGGADLNAVQHQADVVRRRVRTALLQAVGHGLQADGVAVLAVVDALAHLGTDGWQSRLTAPRLREGEFTELFAKLAAVRLKGARVTVIEPLRLRVKLAGGLELTLDLGNLWSECGPFPAGRVEACEGFLRSLAELDANPDLEDGLIVPAIKSAAYIHEVGAKFPLKAEPFVADLWIAYAVDSPSSVKYLQGDHPGEYAELREQAIANLRSVIPSVERHGDRSSYYMPAAGGVYESSLLLADNLWSMQMMEVDGELIAAVPARDAVLFTGSRNARGLAELRSTVERIWRNGSYQISRSLLVRRGNRWEEYRA
jgi:hypothetical protein